MANSNSTIKFNVGGRLFEVSRALIDQHSDTMLGKLVSDVWQEDPEETVFIDRNGDTFAYVLDYLRYGSIELPINIPKASFERDLDFYGLAPEKGAITDKSFIQVAEQLRADLRDAQNKHDMYFLAFEAHNQFIMNKKDKCAYVQVNITNNNKVYNARVLSNDEIDLFKTYLEAYFGLKLATTEDGVSNAHYHVPKTSGAFCVTSLN